jgi:hypothetical protein
MSTSVKHTLAKVDVVHEHDTLEHKHIAVDSNIGGETVINDQPVVVAPEDEPEAKIAKRNEITSEPSVQTPVANSCTVGALVSLFCFIICIVTYFQPTSSSTQADTDVPPDEPLPPPANTQTWMRAAPLTHRVVSMIAFHNYNVLSRILIWAIRPHCRQHPCTLTIGIITTNYYFHRSHHQRQSELCLLLCHLTKTLFRIYERKNVNVDLSEK